ncbi:MAG: hypothetical protein L6W00_25670 [Lentisphaeria bacterium]|nr:MAG: hypothetical protein L6W00_25670 [Lentisphaeria bacterium]
MDGRNIEENLPSWQKKIGYVPQFIYLLDDSIRENVAFGVPPEEIDDNRVWQVLEQAQIADFVRSLPGQLAEPMGNSAPVFPAVSDSGSALPVPSMRLRKFSFSMKPPVRLISKPSARLPTLWRNSRER